MTDYRNTYSTTPSFHHNLFPSFHKESHDIKKLPV